MEKMDPISVPMEPNRPVPVVAVVLAAVDRTDVTFAMAVLTALVMLFSVVAALLATVVPLAIIPVRVVFRVPTRVFKLVTAVLRRVCRAVDRFVTVVLAALTRAVWAATRVALAFDSAVVRVVFRVVPMFVTAVPTFVVMLPRRVPIVEMVLFRDVCTFDTRELKVVANELNRVEKRPPSSWGAGDARETCRSMEKLKDPRTKWDHAKSYRNKAEAHGKDQSVLHGEMYLAYSAAHLKLMLEIELLWPNIFSKTDRALSIESISRTQIDVTETRIDSAEFEFFVRVM